MRISASELFTTVLIKRLKCRNSGTDRAGNDMYSTSCNSQDNRFMISLIGLNSEEMRDE